MDPGLSTEGSEGQGDASRESGGLMAPGTSSQAVWSCVFMEQRRKASRQSHVFDPRETVESVGKKTQANQG